MSYMLNVNRISSYTILGQTKQPQTLCSTKQAKKSRNLTMHSNQMRKIPWGTPKFNKIVNSVCTKQGGIHPILKDLLLLDLKQTKSSLKDLHYKHYAIHNVQNDADIAKVSEKINFYMDVYEYIKEGVKEGVKVYTELPAFDFSLFNYTHNIEKKYNNKQKPEEKLQKPEEKLQKPEEKLQKPEEKLQKLEEKLQRLILGLSFKLAKEWRQVT